MLAKWRRDNKSIHKVRGEGSKTSSAQDWVSNFFLSSCVDSVPSNGTRGRDQPRSLWFIHLCNVCRVLALLHLKSNEVETFHCTKPAPFSKAKHFLQTAGNAYLKTKGHQVERIHEATMTKVVSWN